ncbi:hypothetical protein COY20_03825 [Candidatus Shapirobacteria bacterium CG_4_10_14_0_2_um_filter_40_12]|uniref:TraG P-loop domain-containing protein n=1 Tax=Candidatus Shapirobacteria bacterium CG_4_10_14_0_2_um_filter_40_12 TaxID=1974871 RepID=A0A2M7TS41_9BACT|nr:MAG: hypothetical protein COY20_03825 [Candidatus Shapirobacteria bacterium CG_4_10_14_0_2_um_filter_40_12]
MNIFSKLKKKKVEPAVAGTPLEKGGQNGKPFIEGLVSVKDIIAPSALEVDFDHVRIDSKYYRTCFVAGYPRFVGLNWLSTLINFDASLKVSMYIYPTDGKEILDDLRRKIAEMEAEISTDIQRGRVVNPSTQAKLEDALNLQTDLVKGEERFFQFGLYVTIEAPTKDELNRITKNLEAALGALMIISKKATLQMEEGFISTLPLCSDRIGVSRNMDTTSLATTFPFVSSDLSDDKGIMFGINEHNGSLVIFDRFSMQNYNSVVFASAGAGKSYMIKLEVMRSLMLGTEIIVIDPENEYRVLAEAVGGQYIAFGYGEDSKINPFDLSLTVEEGENALNDKVLTLHKMFKIMLGAMDPIEESVLDKAVMEAYKSKGITPDPETQKGEAPLIEDLYKSLIGMEDERAKNLAARMEKYIKGSFAGIFNQKTTVNLKNKFVVFGVRNLEESLRPVAMHIVLDYIWTTIKKELKRRILVVDEAWYLMQFEDSAAFLRGIVKRGRKYYLGVTTITQDVDDFLETPYGKEIVTNSAIQILLKQHSAAIELVGKVFYLSEGEKQLLLTADKGEGIFFAGQNHVAIRVIASEEEHKLITSNPEEILKSKKIFEQKLIEQKKVAPVSKPTLTPVNPNPPKSSFDKEDLEETVENKVLFKAEVESEINPVETELQKKIEKMEAEEKQVLAEHQKKIEAEKAAEGKKLSGTFSNFGGLPKYQELFKAPKLPPLPTPSASQLGGQVISKKPIFMDQPEEPKIPQPAQLAKKPQPVMDYDKLFGNVVDEGKSALAGAMSGEEKKPTDKTEPAKTTTE